MVRAIGASAAVLAAVLSAPAAAQDATPVGPGVRVRVSVAATPDRLKGTVQSLDQSVLSVISDDHQLVKIPRATITRLETGWGRKGPVGGGAGPQGADRPRPGETRPRHQGFHSILSNRLPHGGV